ncbi:hypothetical protein [Amnibacterium sp.]|uniref:hypothetical protein n=1 Tax=Amnibacterium sp. TaxID=1872496 RepID=UPI00261B83AA|nr:hypothetical protein [Amnibacterium sp.]MCU1472894.1 hypothetical protein [Amnibacterium sp.]
MPRMGQRSAFTLGLIALVMVTAGCASPATKATSQPRPTPTVTATLTSGAHEFVSKRYHFRLTLPQGWSGVDAQDVWDGKALQGQESPAFADFADSKTQRVFTIGAAPAAKGIQLTPWRAAVVRGVRAGCVDARTAKKVVLGDEPALTWTATCGEVNPVKFAFVHGDRGYAAIFEASGSSMNAADLAVFDSIRRSFRFTS